MYGVAADAQASGDLFFGVPGQQKVERLPLSS
jgi:hypothetical protein